jgi:hypothetical protein
MTATRRTHNPYHAGITTPAHRIGAPAAETLPFDGPRPAGNTKSLVAGGKSSKTSRILAHAALGCIWLAACGGRSVRTTDDGSLDDEDDVRADAGGNSAGTDGDRPGVRTCEAICNEVSCAASIASCTGSCEQAELVARESGCTTPFQQLIDCYRERRDTLCDRGSYKCTQEQNAFSVCIIDYCDFHPAECAAV